MDPRAYSNREGKRFREFILLLHGELDDYTMEKILMNGSKLWAEEVREIRRLSEETGWMIRGE